MNSIRREHWDQAHAFEDWIGKQNLDDGSAALIKPHYTAWARTKGFQDEDLKIIWKVILFNRRQNRRKKIRPYNKERLERIRGKHTYGPYHQWITSHPCILSVFPDHTCMRYPDGKWVKGHHVVSVGAGGRDWENEVPVCMLAHALCETTWSKVEKKYGISLRDVARKLSDECPMSVIDEMNKGAR